MWNNLENILNEPSKITGLILATLLAVSSYFLLRYFKRFVLRKGATLSAVWVELARQTREGVLFIVAAYMGIHFLGRYSLYVSWWFPYVFRIAFLIQIALWGNVLIKMLLEKRLESTDTTRSTALKVGSFLLRTLFYFVLLVLALENFGVNVTSLIAGLGIGSVAIALAVQNILADIFASLTIVFDKPFVVGDVIIVGEFVGAVENIGIKTTRLRSLYGEQVVFSNMDLLQSRIRNLGRMKERLVIFGLKLDRRTPLTKLHTLGKRIESVISRVGMTHVERVHLKKIMVSGLDYEIVYKVLSPDMKVYMDIQEKVNFGLIQLLTNERIEIAHPAWVLVEKL